MCLYTNNPIPNVAENPIKVYKVLYKDRKEPNVYIFACQFGRVVNSSLKF